jgi:hypothetical protein
MDLRIEIVGDRVICRQDATDAYSASVADFLVAVTSRIDQSCLPEPIPEGVRFVRRRGDTVVLAIEERPQTRTVQWLADDSPIPFGRGAVYNTARLAFPYIVVVVALRRGALTGVQQCFYRVRALERLDDELLLSNLYNVSVNGYGQQCWLCLANLRADLSAMSWAQKTAAIRTHFWSAWNRSSDVHEGASYFTAMTGLDSRIASLKAWEQATLADPLFPLKIAWKPSGKTLAAVVETMLAQLEPLPGAVTATHLAQALAAASMGRKPRGLRSLLFK